ncbi:hypothetical protein M422DRAFT_26973, partial [Sphaerobolus stellatus SS14]
EEETSFEDVMALGRSLSGMVSVTYLPPFISAAPFFYLSFDFCCLQRCLLISMPLFLSE